MIAVAYAALRFLLFLLDITLLNIVSVLDAPMARKLRWQIRLLDAKRAKRN